MRLTSYIIGDVPLFDPCDRCLIVTTCSEQCKDKIIYDKNNPKKQTMKFKIKRKRRRKSESKK